MVLLMIGVFPASASDAPVNGLAVALSDRRRCLAAAVRPATAQAFDGAFIADAFARFMKVLALIGSAVTLVMSVGFARRERSTSSSIRC